MASEPYHPSWFKIQVIQTINGQSRDLTYTVPKYCRQDFPRSIKYHVGVQITLKHHLKEITSLADFISKKQLNRWTLGKFIISVSVERTIMSTLPYISRLPLFLTFYTFHYFPPYTFPSIFFNNTHRSFLPFKHHRGLHFILRWAPLGKCFLLLN